MCTVPRTVTDKLQQVLNAAARVVTGTWMFDCSLSQILHDELHWLDVLDRVFFKLVVTGQRCQRLHTTTKLLRSGRQCRHSAAPAFRQPSTACSTSLPAQHLRPSGLFSCRPPKSGTLSQISSKTRPSVQTVSDVCLKRTCSLDTSAISVLEVLDDNHTL